MASRLYLICTLSHFLYFSVLVCSYPCLLYSFKRNPSASWSLNLLSFCLNALPPNVPVTQFLVLFKFLLKWHKKSCSELCASFILLCFFLYNTVFERNFRFCIFLIYLLSFSSCLNVSPQRTGTLSCWLFTQYKLLFDVVIIIALSLQTRKLKSPERSE